MFRALGRSPRSDSSRRSTTSREFSRVYIVGAEDNHFFKEKGSREEQEESRRVFYVGMTRAKDRLVFTRALSRGGKPTGGSKFLDELGVSQTVQQPT